MNRAKYLQSTYPAYDTYNGVWVVEYEKELYKVILTGDHFTCHTLFDDKRIKDKSLMLAIQAVIATECFAMTEKREKEFDERRR